jgi:hypothetical protein
MEIMQETLDYDKNNPKPKPELKPKTSAQE